jgi:GntR family transcriptional regulator, transcriptional repressor for pyruvate dehydrogenase complex
MNKPPLTHPGFQKISGVRIFERAVEQIREMIINGSIAVGQKLPTEQNLSALLSVSRSSIREALRVLEAEGFVEIKRGLGAFVTSRVNTQKGAGEVASWLERHEESLEQILQVREHIEGLTASLAAANAPDEALAEIRKIVEEQSQKIQHILHEGDEDFDTLAHLDAAFHLAISRASENDIAHEIIFHIIPAFCEGNKAILYVSKQVGALEKEHRAILAALEKRDPAAAEKMMRAHIARVRSEISKME